MEFNKIRPIKHVGTKEIQTSRLKLRRFKKGDEVSMFKNYVTDPEVTRFVRWEVHKDIKETEKLLNIWIDNYSSSTYRWAICLKDTDEVIGSIDVVKQLYNFTTVEIGYCLSRQFWNKGYMSEALTSVIKYMFSVGCNRIQALHDVRNVGSGRVMEKSGMNKEAILKGMAVNNVEYVDLAIWAIINK